MPGRGGCTIRTTTTAAASIADLRLIPRRPTAKPRTASRPPADPRATPAGSPSHLSQDPAGPTPNPPTAVLSHKRRGCHAVPRREDTKGACCRAVVAPARSDRRPPRLPGRPVPAPSAAALRRCAVATVLVGRQTGPLRPARPARRARARPRWRADRSLPRPPATRPASSQSPVPGMPLGGPDRRLVSAQSVGSTWSMAGSRLRRCFIPAPAVRGLPLLHGGDPVAVPRPSFWVRDGHAGVAGRLPARPCSVAGVVRPPGAWTRSPGLSPPGTRPPAVGAEVPGRITA
jgi:hypothetical protein